MKKSVEMYDVYELSDKELQSIDGGSNAIEYFFMAVGYVEGSYDRLMREHDFSNGYLGSKL